MKLNSKLFLGFLLGSLVLVYILSVVFYNDFSSILTKQLLTERKQELLLREYSTEQFLKKLESEIVFLSSLKKKQDFLNITDPELKAENRAELERLLLTYFEEHSEYKEITYIDNSGQEFSHMLRNDDSEIVSTAENELKNRSDGYIFQNTINLEKGELFAALTVDEEKLAQGKKEISLTHSTPIFDLQEQKKGIIVLTVDADFVLGGKSYEQIEKAEDEDTADVQEKNIMFSDKAGHYLYNTDQNKRWNLTSQDGSNLYKDFPAIEPLSDSVNSGEIYNEDDESYLIFNRVKPFSDRILNVYIGPTVNTASGAKEFIVPNDENLFWIQSLLINKAEISDRVSILFFKTLTLMVIILLFFIISMMMFIKRAVIGPIGKIIYGADRIKKGNLDYKLSLGSRKDEFGDLANEFNSMSAVLKRYKETMEQKIYERTEDLDKFKKFIEESQECMIISNPAGVVVYTNDSLERISGYEKNELINRESSIKELWGASLDPKTYENILNTVQAEKKHFIGKIKNRNKNGDEYTALISIIPILDKQGNIEYFFSILTDLTGINL